MRLSKKYGILIFLFFSIEMTFSQNFFMGIPEGRDSLYDLTDKKAFLCEENYRNVGSSFSLKEYTPTPGHQGNYGTCAAWATTYCARTILESIANEETDKILITGNAFSPGFIYRLASNNPQCSGSISTDCAQRMKDYGVPKMAEFSIDCPIDLPKNIYHLAQEHKIKAYVKLFDNTMYNEVNDKEKIQFVKKSISEKYPVVISMICPNSFMDKKMYGNDLWLPTEDLNSQINHQHGRHALCVVGYDDEKYGGAFEIQNSWGTDWGNEGYVWIKYSDFAKFTYQA
ncbi:MAG: C1 family peptidase, partial [Crocinitomicaceae bacterium]|nr:C1 family peptidase [Crocinitomicaceae bacterium]